MTDLHRVLVEIAGDKFKTHSVYLSFTGDGKWDVNFYPLPWWQKVWRVLTCSSTPIVEVHNDVPDLAEFRVLADRVQLVTRGGNRV